MLNKIARVHLKILVSTIAVTLLLVIPKVMAMSSSQEALALRPYGVFAFLFWLSGVSLRFIQARFLQLKRGFDIMVASISLMITSPIIVLAALGIKLFSPKGPVFYSQLRVGENGRIFKIYKLRSMKPDAENGTGAIWSSGEADPRLIPFIGRLMRKAHIDEIPQFFNVLKGEMSVVGPRPERPEIVNILKYEIPEYEKRLRVKPGITGLAQVRSRYDKTLSDVKKKVKLDLLYIRKMCLFTELNIIFKTVLVILTGKALG
ncbi:MAG: sugar transferase [Candidatus Omnitrophica bacterium]|nr:sugar transferase [Candidatus Omnitrophota bacterium]MCG2711133.1 sugar transferase [Candidatus Omnitrophota bacterium]